MKQILHDKNDKMLVITQKKLKYLLSVNWVTKSTLETSVEECLITGIILNLLFSGYVICSFNYGRRFFVVLIRDGKTHRSRSFTIIKWKCPFDPCTSYHKYTNLRPKNMEERREWAWLTLADGKFVFLHLTVAIIQWTREERSFCVEAYFLNALSIHTLFGNLLR